MDETGKSILTQVAFKATVELEREVDLTDPDGQARFEQVFSYITDSLFTAVAAQTGERAGEVIKAAFPGSVQLPPQQYQQPPAQQGWYAQPALPVTVKGQQFGPLPDWLLTAAADKGVTEVYDNRDRAQGTKRPWFRATTTSPARQTRQPSGPHGDRVSPTG